MSTQDSSVAGAAARTNGPWPECLNEKLVHRALGEQRRAATAAMSPRARDRLYARMFPTDICGSDTMVERNSTLGAHADGKLDPIS